MLLFGFFALILTGLSWTLTGVALSGVSRRNVDATYLLFFGPLVGIIISLGVMAGAAILGQEWVSQPMDWRFLLDYFLVGAINYGLMYLGSVAMSRGPNNIVWCILQSGTVISFIMGIVAFGEPLSWTRLLGMILMMAAMVFFSVVRKNDNAGKVSDRSWIYLSFLAFLICGFQHCLAALPSYFESGRAIHSVIRSMVTGIGATMTPLAIIIAKFIKREYTFKFVELRNKWLWFYVAFQLAFGTFCAYFLTYRGLDILAENNCGALGYPVMVVSCIVGFFLYSALVLREKTNLIHWFAFLACVVGIGLAAYIPKEDAAKQPEVPAVIENALQGEKQQ
jgi:drug/metabolite transporter (DMT)-like permease